MQNTAQRKNKYLLTLTASRQGYVKVYFLKWNSETAEHCFPPIAWLDRNAKQNVKRLQPSSAAELLGLRKDFDKMGIQSLTLLAILHKHITLQSAWIMFCWMTCLPCLVKLTWTSALRWGFVAVSSSGQLYSHSLSQRETLSISSVWGCSKLLRSRDLSLCCIGAQACNAKNQWIE